MPARLAARLHAAREHLFVGRDDEMALFQTTLDAEELPFFVLHVYGPGGIGKTTLLRAYERVCQKRNVAAYYLDARDVEPLPEMFTAALGRACGLAAGDDPLAALAAHKERLVLLIDTYEEIAVLDDWLRERILPNLTDNVFVVLAGREPPSQTWRVDLGWQTLLRILPLRNLDAQACRTYLRLRNVPETQHEAVLGFTYGHPLATSLVADVLDQQHVPAFEPQKTPGVIQTLLERFVQHVPGPAHRTCLEVCALVRFTTEDLLQTVLDVKDVHELFEWLRGLSFVQAGVRGLLLHDLARDMLLADLRWRNSEWYTELHRRARWYYTERLKRARQDFDRLILSDYTFLHRDHPLVRPLVNRLQSQWSTSDPIFPERAQEADWPALIAMTTRHEGTASAALAQHWFERQPDNIVVFRDRTGEPLGYELALDLDQASSEDRATDPAAQRAWAYLETHAPLRQGEHALLFRFWMARDTYQDISPLQSLISLGHVRHYLNTAGLAFTLLTYHNPSFWAPIMALAAMKRIPEADFNVGDRTYTVFGHDWRVMPPTAWLDRLAEHPLARIAAKPPETLHDQILVLSRADFEAAVWDAFRAYLRPEKLYDNPLVRSRMVIDQVGLEADDTARIEALCRILAETAALLKGAPQETRYYHVLRRTYIQPAPTQEKAAELLDLPMSTYRRYLKRGLEHVTAMLWEQEIGHV